MASHTRVDEPAPSQSDLLPTDAPAGRVPGALMARAVVRGLSAIALLALAVVIAWIVDLQLHSSRVLRNVKVAGVAVGGLDGQVRLFNLPSGQLSKAFVPVPLAARVAASK